MKQTDLRSLSRTDLLEMLIEQGEELEKLRSRNGELEQQLHTRSMHVKEAGSLAEAALMVSGIFEAAQAASDQYYQNIQVLAKEQEESTQKAKTLLKETEIQCELMKAQTQQKCDQMIEKAKRESLAYWAKVYRKLENDRG